MDEKVKKILVTINGAFVALGALTVLGALVSKGTAGFANNQVAIAALIVSAVVTVWSVAMTKQSKLDRVEITDDYSSFANKVAFEWARAYENDQDVTDQYTVKDEHGRVVATRKDPQGAPNGGHVALKATWAVPADGPAASLLANGSGTVGSHSKASAHGGNITAQITMDLSKQADTRPVTKLGIIAMALFLATIMINLVVA